MKPEVVAIVAVAKNGVIGAEGGLPWRISGDLKRFKALTMGKPLIMGRRTFEALPRPLLGRELVIVTRRPSLSAPGARFARSPDEALEIAREIARASGAKEICIGGGGEIYRALLEATDRVELTEIDLAPEGDAYLPPFDLARWRETARVAPERGPRDEADYAFVTLERRRG
ncbi:dihydrofolate reductase [Methylocystis bryophila]|uniref:Dihydrofolate reductase n=1 Tax=Methylocystis bryophila TaxID=655015 RepID=A0A1W6MV05_9HYPH|nr:dihydrofolate reductase [Methylocystis bryophila]ARN81412.1 diacylglycerol kinase [Methylocystis bryophila]BDV37408.1 dihydrofolate reductase [Methylocystis bryophila]